MYRNLHIFLYMSLQIFKKEIPKELLLAFLDKNCMKNEKHYVFNRNAYKKAVYTQTLESFILDCRPYYHASKMKYLDRKMTYNALMTVLRQICNALKITYTSQIKYDKSVYDIVYYIYF